MSCSEVVVFFCLFFRKFCSYMQLKAFYFNTTWYMELSVRQIFILQTQKVTSITDKYQFDYTGLKYTCIEHIHALKNAINFWLFQKHFASKREHGRGALQTNWFTKNRPKTKLQYKSCWITHLWGQNYLNRKLKIK